MSKIWGRYVRFDKRKMKRYIKDHGMTMSAYAKLIGVTERTIYRWRTEEKMPIDRYIEMLDLFDDLDIEALDQMGSSIGARLV